MSSELGMQFGTEYQEDYAKILDKWAGKAVKIGVSTPKLEAQWGSDLQNALGEPVFEALLASEAIKSWKGTRLPSQETMEMFAKIAVKYSLAFATADLLRRLIKSSKTVQAAATPGELLSRAKQTVAQIFDMAKDAFNAVLNRFLQRKEELTGRRRWVATGDSSRHAALHHEIRREGEAFTYKKRSIQGPRPVDGHPEDWSNCSCYLEYERTDGEWIRG